MAPASITAELQARQWETQIFMRGLRTRKEHGQAVAVSASLERGTNVRRERQDRVTSLIRWRGPFSTLSSPTLA